LSEYFLDSIKTMKQISERKKHEKEI